MIESINQRETIIVLQTECSKSNNTESVFKYSNMIKDQQINYNKTVEFTTFPNKEQIHPKCFVGVFMRINCPKVPLRKKLSYPYNELCGGT